MTQPIVTDQENEVLNQSLSRIDSAYHFSGHLGPSHTSMNAPWGVEARKKLAIAAIGFFCLKNPSEVKLSGVPEEPLSLLDFLNHLRENRTFAKQPNAHRVYHIIEKMVENGLLSRVSVARFGAVPFVYSCYHAIDPYSQERRGAFRLCSSLGPEFTYRLMAPGIVHITGDDSNGDVRAGTGLVLDKHHILTCRHVVQDMKLHPEQSFQGMKCKISRNEIKSHKKHDVAVIRVYDELRPTSGLVFQSPVIAQTVFALGYPRVPMAKQHVLTIHHGAVTCESVEMFAGNNLFLYSSISRPGNSGGPIVSDEGYVVGMSAQLNNTNRLGDGVSLPHNAGIDSKTIIDSIVDMGLDLNLDFEEYE